MLARSEDEIVRAHDLLVGILVGELREVVESSPDGLRSIAAAADVLCWLLGHEHNQNFGGNLARLEVSLLAAGYHLRLTDDHP